MSDARSMSGIASLAVLLSLAPCIAGEQTAAQAAPQGTAVAPEKNPPGDIPDDQVFVTYKSPAGFSIEVPEGWSRTERANGVVFADKYGSLDVSVEKRAAEPTIESVKTAEIPLIIAGGHAAEIGKTFRLAVPQGKAIAVDYTSNSDVNPVTNCKIRLESRRIYYFTKGQQAVLTLAAPAGADNVDQWKLIAESFRWAK